jgi:hypothetical protein
MKPLNIFILSKNRECQTKALIDSLQKHLQNTIEIKFTILYDETHTDTQYHVISYRKFLRDYNHLNFISVSYDNNPPNVEDYFITDEYNLVLPDTTIFTLDFDLSFLSNINEHDILDLFKGLNRQKNSVHSSEFLSEVQCWKREGYLYSIEKEGRAFEQLPKNLPYKYYGKIFYHTSNITFDDRKIYFYPLSPCFINAVNKAHDFIDFYNLPYIKEYNPYAFSTRYMCGESIDIDEISNYSPNALLDQRPYKFKRSFL